MMQHTSTAPAGVLNSNASNGSASQEDLDRLTGAGQRLTWDDLDVEDQRDWILGNAVLSEWFQPAALETLAAFYPIKTEWGRIKARYREYRGNDFDLEQAVKALVQLDHREREAHVRRPDPLRRVVPPSQALPT